MTGGIQKGMITKRMLLPASIDQKGTGKQLMPVMDEFKRERESLKDKPFKEKWSYFWYYYKVHVIVVLCILVLVITTVRDVLTTKDIAFYVAFLNCFSTDQDAEFIDDFAQLTDIDLEKQEVYLDSNMRFNVSDYDENSMAAAQKFLAMSSAGEIDVVVTDRNVFGNYADNGTFADLRNYLTEDQLEKYKEHFFYFDEAVLHAEVDYEAIANSDLAIPEDTVERRDPSAMETPIPVGIFLDDSMKHKLTDIGYFAESQEIIFGIMGSEENKVYCQQFIDWLTGEE